MDFTLGLYNANNVPVNVDETIKWIIDQQINGISIQGDSQYVQLVIDEMVVSPCTFVLKAKYYNFEEKRRIQVIELEGNKIQDIK